MRRSLAVLATAAATLAVAAPAHAARDISCGQATGKIGTKTYTFATKIKARGIDCPTAKAFFVAFATGEAGPSGTEALRTSCKERGGTKAEKKAARKQGRAIYRCKSGSQTLTGWVLQG